MTFMYRKQSALVLSYLVLTVLGVLIIYPFFWLVGSSFKETHEIFAQPSFIPAHPTVRGYVNGWKAAGGVSFTTFFINTYTYVILKVAATVVSCVMTAYGFARFDFLFKKQLMSLLIATLLFPMTVILVPSYIMFSQLRWVDSYLPLIVPSLFAADTFFVFMMIQFFRTLPRDMDEAAMIDGCGPVRRLLKILIPLLQPAIVTAALFQFIWSSNEFLGPMIYLSSEKKFPVSVGLKLTMDTASGSVAWENIMAMSVLAILPPLVVFIIAQRQFVEGISTTGLKG